LVTVCTSRETLKKNEVFVLSKSANSKNALFVLILSADALKARPLAHHEVEAAMRVMVEEVDGQIMKRMLHSGTLNGFGAPVLPRKCNLHPRCG
jgi:hypothetical protein